MSQPSVNWSVATIGSLCEQIRGVTYSKDEASDRPSNGLVPILRANNILADGMLSFDDLVYVPPSVVADAQYFRKHDILLATSSGSLDVVGKAAQTRQDWHGAFGAFCKVLRPNNKVEPRYLAYFFRTSQYRHRVSNLAAGANINNLRNEHIEELSLPIPHPTDLGRSVLEQGRIADILDKADDVRRKRQEAVGLTTEFLQALYLEMFGSPRVNDKGWLKQPLEEICSVDRGKFTPRPRNDPRYYGGPYPFIQTGDISSSGGILRQWKQTLNDDGVAVSRSFPARTVVIAIVGATIGETAILAREMYCPDSVIGIIAKPNKATAEYIEFTLRFHKQLFRDMAPETARANINLETLRPLCIPTPPIKMQQQFSMAFQKCYEIKDKVTDPKDETVDLFESLVQRAFRGEL